MARAEELIRLLDMAHRFVDGNPNRNHIDGLEHNLRVAGFARRWAKNAYFPGYENQVDLITFMGLVHDLARPLSEPYHGEVIAEIVRDMVTEEMYNVLRTHGEYQAEIVHEDPSRVREPSAYWVSLARKMAAWEEASFSKTVTQVPLTKSEAVTLIYKICAGRD